jgi:hypothetical protein
MASISGQNTSNINGVDGFFTTQGGSGGTVSTTPTITATASGFGMVTVVVTNHSSYINPNYYVESKVGTTTTILDSNVRHILDPSGNRIGDQLIIADNNPISGERTLTVKAQEFGDFIQSSGATATYTPVNVQSRYLRVRGVTSAGVETGFRLAIGELRFYSESNGKGSKYPSKNLTSDTSETGIILSAGHSYSSTYAPWKACDSNINTLWWALGTIAANNWWQIQFDAKNYPTPPIMKSLVISFHNQTDATYFSLKGSDTGKFSGEEIDYGIYPIIESTNQTFG